MKICARCGVKVNKELNKCPFCLSTSFEELLPNNSLQDDDNFTSNGDKKSLPYKWKFCRKCGVNIDYHYSKCPNCNSNCLNDIESNHEIKLFTPPNKKTRVVINKPDNDAESIPEYSESISKEHADNEVESISESSENISKEHANNESAILLFLKHKLFYKKYEGEDLYIFSRLKFIIVLIFVLLFIFMVLCSFDFVTSLIGLAISIFPVYILACFEHGESEVTSELIESRKGNISDNVIHFLCYWYEEEDNIFVFAKTKAISFLIYIVVFIHQYYATNSLLFAWIIGLILYVVALFGGTIIHGALYAEKSSKEITKQEKKVNEIQKEKIVSKPKTITKKQPTNESEVLKPKVKLPLIKYKYETNELSSKFELKQKKAREIIEKRFEPPQMKYNKFINVVDSSCELFEDQVETIMTIINSSTEPSLEVEEEIKSKINVLKELIEKIDSLTNEFLLSISESNNQNVENVLDELELLKILLKIMNDI